jgi:hypothetical protein
MRVRIFQQPKSAMQSGLAGTQEWVIEWAPSDRRTQDPLMGWFGSSDTQSQVRLRFDTREEAVAFAERRGLTYDLELPRARVHKPKAYADNFKFGRTDNWTH